MRHRFLTIGCCVVVAALSAGPAGERSYTAGRAALEIDGETQFVHRVEGGTAVADVVKENQGPDGIVRKHVGSVKFEDIVVDVQPPAFTNVIKNALDGKTMPLNGAVNYVDFDYKTTRRQTFSNALVTGVKFPALDGSSKEPGRLQLTLSPEMTREEDGKGDVMKQTLGDKQKAFIPANFRVKVGELPANRVASVSAIELRGAPVASQVGEMRDSMKQPSRLEIPNIKLTISSADAKPWQQWHEEFVIKGNNSQDKEKSMQIDLLAPTMKDVIMTLDFSGVGIVAMRPVATEAGSDKIARIEVELYAEQVKLSTGGKPVAEAPAAAPTAAAPTNESAPAAKEPAAATAAPAEPTDAGRTLTRAQRERLRARTAEPAPQQPAPAK